MTRRAARAGGRRGRRARRGARASSARTCGCAQTRSTPSCSEWSLVSTWSATGRRRACAAGAAHARAARQTSGARCDSRQSPVGVDALVVVDVQQPAAGSPQRLLVRPRAARSARRRPRGDPTSSCRRRRRRRARVRSRRGTRESVTSGSPRASDRSSSTFAGHRDGIASRMLRSTISVAFASSSMWQPAGRNGKPLLDRPFDVATGAAEQSAEAAVEAELAGDAADEVEHGAERLARRSAQPAAELLEEQRRALGGTQHQHRVDRGHVDALVEQVDGEHDVALAPAARSASAAVALGRRAVAPDRDGRRCRAR